MISILRENEREREKERERVREINNSYNMISGDLHFLWSDTEDWAGLQYRCGVWQDQMKILVVGSETELRLDGEQHL